MSDPSDTSEKPSKPSAIDDALSDSGLNAVRSKGRKGKRKLRVVSLNVMIPNLLTLLALCAGMTAIRFALQDKFEAAGLAILVAAILDTLDGRVARLLKGSTKLGAELDSLSDLVCFGVAPAIVLHLWSLHEVPRFGWVVSLIFACCCALRLARFNTMLEDPNKPAWAAHFFMGTPAPAAAGLALLPMIFSFVAGDDFVREPIVVGAVLLSVAFLMVSRFPTFSFKKIRIPSAYVMPTMVGAVGAIACLVSAPWWTLSVLMIVYLITIPYAFWMYQKYERTSAASVPTK